MLKKAIIILLTTLLSMNSGVLSDNYISKSYIKGYEIDDNYNEAIAEYNKAYEIAAEAMNAYELLSTELFQYDSNGYTIYPDDYSGSWIDVGILIIALTKQANSDLYKRLLSKFTCIEFVEKQHSLNQLQAIASSLEADMKKSFDLCGYYVDYQSNKIIFEIADDIDSSRTKFNNIITEHGIDLNLAEIEPGQHMQLDADVIGGMKLASDSSSGSSRSLGVCGTVTINGSSYDGFVTAGHGLSTSGSSSYIYKYNSSLLGRVKKANYYNGAVGDFSCVKLTNSNYEITNKFYYTTSSTTTRRITGYVNDVAVGSPVLKYGYYYGYASGIVRQQGFSISDGNGITVYGFTRCQLTAGSVGSGDSGGPCYINSSGAYKYVGVYDGSTANYQGTGYTMFYVTPYCRFSSYFTPWIYND